MACLATARSFTTPPTTRKRKAAEAAISENESTSAKQGSDLRSRNAHAHATGPSSSNSREDSPSPRRGSGSTATALADLEVVPVRQKKQTADLATPATTTESMDSDDEFMSDASSQDFLDTQASDDESLGEGGFIVFMTRRL